jgi:hypothetical protein
MNSMLFTVIALYRTEQDYNMDRPEAIYVITARRYLKQAQQRVELIRMRYKGVKVELLIDRRGKDVITPILNLCYGAKRIESPSIW